MVTDSFGIGRKIVSKKQLQITDSGWTLIEIMVTLLIIGMVTVLVNSSFNICLQVWKKGEDKVFIHQQIRSGLQLATERISSSFISSFNPKISFDAGINYINFTAIVSRDSELKNIRIEKVDQMLIMKETPITETKEVEETVLIKGVDYLEFEYYDQINQQWLTNWNTERQKGFPTAVRISLTVYISGQKARLTLPLIVIPIRVNQPCLLPLKQKGV